MGDNSDNFPYATRRSFRYCLPKPKTRLNSNLRNDARSPQNNHDNTNDFKAVQKKKLGDIAMKEKRYHEAIEYYTNAIEQNPMSPEYFTSRAKCYFEMGEYYSKGSYITKAYSDFHTSILSDPGCYSSHLQAMKCCLILGNIEGADEITEKIIKKFDRSTFELTRESKNVIELKRLDMKISKLYSKRSFIDCLNEIEKVLEIAVFCSRYQGSKIKCLIMLNKFEKTFEMIVRSPLRFYYVSLAYFQQGQLDDCLETLQKFKIQNATHEEANELYEITLNMKRNYEDGKKCYESKQYVEAKHAFLLALEKGSFSCGEITKALYYNVGSADMKLKDFKSAIENFNKLLRIHNHHFKALKKRAKAHFGLQEYEECIIDCKELDRLNQRCETIEKLLKDANERREKCEKKRYFEVLGVRQNADKKEVSAAYRSLMFKYHPDKHPGATEIEKKKLAHRFKQVQSAYEIFKF